MLENLREEYSDKGIDEISAGKNPFELFSLWLDQAIQSKIPEPNAMVLSTVSPQAKPSSRTVLLKGMAYSGFQFYTNYLSKKSMELKENPYASLLFLWLPLERQVRIEGKIEKLSEADSDEYFAGRPRPSQLGAWASKQSEKVAGRSVLETSFEQMKTKFGESTVPRPEFWGGYNLIPGYFEFWQGRRGRLHDRIVFEKSHSDWKIYRLSP